jgi:hypothetical protein
MSNSRSCHPASNLKHAEGLSATQLKNALLDVFNTSTRRLTLYDRHFSSELENSITSTPGDLARALLCLEQWNRCSTRSSETWHTHSLFR